MLPEFRPAAGAAGWAVSNPPIFSAAPLLASLEMFRAAGIDELRAKSVRLTAYAERLLRERVRRRRADHHARGAGRARLPASACASAAARGAGGASSTRWPTHGVVCDWREPDIIRIAPVPLYNRFVDVFEFVEELAAALKEIA